MTKIRKCYSLDEEIVVQITRIAVQNARPESEILTKLLEYSLSKNMDTTAAERFHYQRKVIVTALDSVLRTMGVLHYDGSVSDKVKHALYACHGIGRQKTRKLRHSMIELSIFEILNDIRWFDEQLYYELKAEMRFFGRMKDRYVAMYPD